MWTFISDLPFFIDFRIDNSSIYMKSEMLQIVTKQFSKDLTKCQTSKELIFCYWYPGNFSLSFDSAGGAVTAQICNQGDTRKIKIIN